MSEPGVALDASGPAAPPRRNGELVFDAPWQSRVFGLTMALIEAGRIEHEAFRERLIAEIARWERDAPAGAAYVYWERWQAALEATLAAQALCGDDEIDARSRAFAARPHGHDHPHRD